MAREEEYKAKCRRVKAFYSAEIRRNERNGCFDAAESARIRRRMELEALDRQYRDGEAMVGCENPVVEGHSRRNPA